MARFRLGVPPAGVYFVSPLFIAAMAASLMNCGVSKSGSPAPIAITSFPSAFSLAALADTARVGEGLMTLRRFETSDMARFQLGGWRSRGSRILLDGGDGLIVSTPHQVGHERPVECHPEGHGGKRRKDKAAELVGQGDGFRAPAEEARACRNFRA